MSNTAKWLLCMAAGAFGYQSASAAVVTLLPTGALPTQTAFLSYYNGGYSANPNYPTGPSDGITFTSTVEELNLGSECSTCDKAENAPSNAVFYAAPSSSVAGVLNDAAGFSSLSLQYSLLNNSATYSGTLYLYAGLNGTGTQVGSISFAPSATPTACTVTARPVPDEFCSWQSATSTQTGIAESVVLAPAGQGLPNVGREFDNIQLAPVPIPAAGWLILSGLGGLGAFVRRRRGA